MIETAKSTVIEILYINVKRPVQIDTQLDWVDVERMAYVVVYCEQKSVSVCVDSKDVEQQHGESLSYLGQRHKDGTEWIPGNSATSKDKDGNVLREYRLTKYTPLGPGLGPVNRAVKWVIANYSNK